MKRAKCYTIRLEAATSRLEDIAIATSSASLISIPEPSAPVTISNNATPVPTAIQLEETSPAVEAYNDIISGPLAAYVNLSKEVGGVVEEQVRPLPRFPNILT